MTPDTDRCRKDQAVATAAGTIASRKALAGATHGVGSRPWGHPLVPTGTHDVFDFFSNNGI